MSFSYVHKFTTLIGLHFIQIANVKNQLQYDLQFCRQNNRPANSGPEEAESTGPEEDSEWLGWDMWGLHWEAGLHFKDRGA